MAARANIVINDGQTTPAAHTFTPVGRPLGTNYEYFVERTSGIPSAQAEVRIRLRTPPQNSNQPFKVDAVILVPETATVDNVVQIISQNRVDLTFTFSAKSTTADRKDIVAFAKNLLANALVVATLHDLEAIY
jgi:hypothetical protein